MLPLQEGTSAGTAAIAWLVGRLAFSWIFILSGIGHLTKSESMAQYAAAFKVPQPRLAVVLSGVIVLAGGLSVLLGVYVEAGTLLLVLFLVPVAIYMHPYWGVTDPMQAATQRAHFMKNISLAGAALLLWYFSHAAPGAWVYALHP